MSLVIDMQLDGIISGVIVGLAVGAGVAYLTSFFNLRSQMKLSDRQQRHETFGRLMGLKLLVMQLYVSRFEARIFSDYHEYRWKLSGYQKDSLDLQEAQRWMCKSEDLSLEIARINQTMFETIGHIRALFPTTTDLQRLIDRLYRFETPDIKPPMNIEDLKLIEKWKTEAVKQLQKLVEDYYGKLIDDLLDYLAKQMA